MTRGAGRWERAAAEWNRAAALFEVESDPVIRVAIAAGLSPAATEIGMLEIIALRLELAELRGTLESIEAPA